MIETIATGEWLTERRITAVATMMLIATIASLAVLFAGAHGTLDALGRPLGTDFSNVWTAGWMADHGRAALAWDWPAHHAVQVATHHDPTVPFYGWHYPPPFLLVAALLATMPYVPALIVWQAATLMPALLLVRRIVPGRRTLLVALAAPVVLVCLGHGHNGFLSAALLGGGLLLLDRRPFAGRAADRLPRLQAAVRRAAAAGAAGRRALAGDRAARCCRPRCCASRRWRSGAGRCGRRSSTACR